jgi:hypothetical protein
MLLSLHFSHTFSRFMYFGNSSKTISIVFVMGRSIAQAILRKIQEDCPLNSGVYATVTASFLSTVDVNDLPVLASLQGYAFNGGKFRDGA